MATTNLLGKQPLPEYGATPIASSGSDDRYAGSELAVKRQAAIESQKKYAVDSESQGEDILGPIGGVIGGIIGAYFGGPMGAIAGFKAGSQGGKGIAEIATNDPGKAAGNLTGGLTTAIGIKGKKKPVVDPTSDPNLVGDTPMGENASDGLESDMEMAA